MLNSIKMATIAPAARARNRFISAAGTMEPAPLLIDPEQQNPIRIFSLLTACIVIFLRAGNVQQMQVFLLHGTNLPMLYLFALPALLGTVLCGGLHRTFRGRSASLWLVFAAWLALCIPFSSWRGGSLSELLKYFRADLVMLFFAGGLAVEWNECKWLMRALAYAGFVSLLSGELFLRDVSGRFNLEFGSIANANDFAAHLLFCFPFVYWFGASSRSVTRKLLSFAGLSYGSYLIMGTGSRGGFLGLSISLVCLFLWSSSRQRLAMLVVLLIGMIATAVFVPHTAWERISTLWQHESPVDPTDTEAEASASQRKYLLQKSIEYTISHPMFGVGLRQFSSYEGQHNDFGAGHGAWMNTHNGFTQISSENGLPALLLFVAAIIASFRILYKIHQEARRRPDCEDIEKAALAVMLSMVGFFTAFTFLNLAYTFYPCLFAGLAVTFLTTTKAEFARRDDARARQAGAAADTAVAVRAAASKRRALPAREVATF
jgi:O-antigen ligase